MNSPHTPLPSTPFPRPPHSHLPPPIASPPLYSPIYFHSPLHPPPLSLLSVILFLFFFLPLVPHSTYHFLFSPFARSYFSIISPRSPSGSSFTSFSSSSSSSSSYSLYLPLFLLAPSCSFSCSLLFFLIFLLTFLRLLSSYYPPSLPSTPFSHLLLLCPRSCPLTFFCLP